MRYFVLLVLCATAFADPCVILKRATGGDHAWSGIEFYYVKGDYPPGYKFRTNLRGRHVRDLVKKGGRFAVVEPNYNPAQLEQAEKQCQAQPEKVAAK